MVRQKVQQAERRKTSKSGENRGTCVRRVVALVHEVAPKDASRTVELVADWPLATPRVVNWLVWAASAESAS